MEGWTPAQVVTDLLEIAVEKDMLSRVPTILVGDESPVSSSEASATLGLDAAFDRNVSAAAAAASSAFGTAAQQLTLSSLWLGGGFDAMLTRAHVLGDFLRANPDAPDEALPIHLKRAGLAGDMPQGLRVTAAIAIFRAALAALDHADKAQAALDNPPEPLDGGGFGGEQAFQPMDDGFAPTGFSPR